MRGFCAGPVDLDADKNPLSEISAHGGNLFEVYKFDFAKCLRA